MALGEKTHEAFGKMAIDKRRLQSSQLTSRGIPAYVAEWVLDSVVPGSGALTSEEIVTVNEWSRRVIPIPTEQRVIKHRIAMNETVRVLTPVHADVRLRQNKQPVRVAQLPMLGIDDALVADSLLADYPDLLRQGMWGVAEVSQLTAGTALMGFKPMQATVNLELFKETRARFSTEEWRDILLISMGYEPKGFSEEQRTLLLCRLLPLAQKNMHLLELAPKGTGKSFVYENISTRVRVVSGGNISPAVLFVNNQTGHWGLLARFAVVVLDEVQTLKFERPEEIIGGLKGYLANNKLTRGGAHESTSDCGLVLLANIRLDSEQRPASDLLIEDLPTFLQETAFLDRLKGIIPGWKLPKLSSALLIGPQSENSIGLKADLFGSILLALREDTEADQYVRQHIALSGARPFKRNEDAVHAIAAGLMKIQFPDGKVAASDFQEYCVRPALELRQNVWDQLYILDAEYRQFERHLQLRHAADGAEPIHLNPRPS